MRKVFFMLALIARIGPVQEAPRDAPSVPVDGLHDHQKMTALRRDPRSLPRSAEGRWKNFERTTTAAEPPPEGMREAAIAIRERDLPRALVLLYGVLDSEPDYPPGLYEMGVVYFRLQRYGDAAAALERFLAVAPARVGETRVLGHSYYSVGDYTRAKAHYERVLAAAPREVEALRGLALCEMHLGEAQKALDFLGRVLELEPRHTDSWAWKAQLLFDLDRSQEALVAAERARDLDPWQPRPWFLLGRILLDLGREKDGLAAQVRYRNLAAAAQDVVSIESRLEYLPHEMPLLTRLVELHRSTGNVPAARKALVRLVRERPTDVDLRILALDVLEGMGDAEGARVAAQALQQRCTEEWKAWQRLERYYARTGEKLQRVEAGERFRRLKPD
jgi:tetratricopeptide (TPR) repeat protein